MIFLYNHTEMSAMSSTKGANSDTKFKFYNAGICHISFHCQRRDIKLLFYFWQFPILSFFELELLRVKVRRF